MKKMTVVWMAGLASLLAGAQTWTFTVPRAWSRTEKAATLAPPADVTVETDHLKVVVSGMDAALVVTDKRTGRVWASSSRRRRSVPNCS